MPKGVWTRDGSSMIFTSYSENLIDHADDIFHVHQTWIVNDRLTYLLIASDTAIINWCKCTCSWQVDSRKILFQWLQAGCAPRSGRAGRAGLSSSSWHVLSFFICLNMFIPKNVHPQIFDKITESLELTQFHVADSHLVWDSTSAAKVQLLPLAFCRPGWTLDYWLLFPGAYPVRQTQIWRQVVCWLSEVGCPILKPGRLQSLGKAEDEAICQPEMDSNSINRSATMQPNQSSTQHAGTKTWSHSRAEEMMFFCTLC